MSVKIIESLDYGMSLLEDGRVVKSDGTVISIAEYQKMQENAQRNKLDWTDVEVDEFFAMIDSAVFATKTYAEVVDMGGITQSKYGFAIVTEDGEPIYLRSNEFSGSEKFEMAIATFSKLIYNVSKNSSEEASDTLAIELEELFGTTEQLGSEFSPDSENTFLIKKFIKDGYVWSIVFKNGVLSNVKQGEKLHQEMEVGVKTSKVQGRLDNMNLV